MTTGKPGILTINGGSSSIKFSLYQLDEPLRLRFVGKMDRIGLSGTTFTFNDRTSNQQDSRNLAEVDHKTAAIFLMEWLEKQNGVQSVRAVGHRVVHGMQHTAPELITRKLLDERHRVSPYAPEHLPRENELIEAFRERHPNRPQVSAIHYAAMWRPVTLFPDRR